MAAAETDYLLRLLSEGESDRVEFKESLSRGTADDIREAICAFANDLPDHRQPGVVFVGARDDGSATGIAVTDELLRQLADMKTDGNIVPPPSLTVEKRNTPKGDIAAIIVQPSDSPPVRCRGRIHIRIGPRRGIATAQDERILNEKRRYRDIPFDIHPVPSATLRDLDLLRFEYEYLPQAFAPDILAANDRSPEERLAATKMVVSVDDTTPTMLGLLALGKRPLAFLPGAYIQFLKFAGNDLLEPIEDEESVSGTIKDVIERIDVRLNSHNRTAVDILSGPLERRTYTYPTTAVQQIVRNAIMHRSYEGNNAPVRVYWYNDRIEIISPGGVFDSVTAENFGRPGITAYRNPNLADAMKSLGFVQRYGTGISLSQRLLRQAGHPAIEFDVDLNNVIAIIKPAYRQAGEI